MLQRAMVIAAALACLCGPVYAGPITYNAQLFDGIAVTGEHHQAPDNLSNPVGAEYFSFFANAGDTVTVFADRLAGHYDPALWVFSGLYSDTDDFGGDLPGAQVFNFVGFGDDEDAPHIPGDFGDPRVIFDAPVTGYYTVAVTNFLSSADAPNPFQIQADGVSAASVPEPASAILLGAGALGVAAFRRRRHNA